MEIDRLPLSSKEEPSFSFFFFFFLPISFLFAAFFSGKCTVVSVCRLSRRSSPSSFLERAEEKGIRSDREKKRDLQSIPPPPPSTSISGRLDHASSPLLFLILRDGGGGGKRHLFCGANSLFCAIMGAIFHTIPHGKEIAFSLPSPPPSRCLPGPLLSIIPPFACSGLFLLLPYSHISIFNMTFEIYASGNSGISFFFKLSSPSSGHFELFLGGGN